MRIKYPCSLGGKSRGSQPSNLSIFLVSGCPAPWFGDSVLCLCPQAHLPHRRAGFPSPSLSSPFRNPRNTPGPRVILSYTHLPEIKPGCLTHMPQGPTLSPALKYDRSTTGILGLLQPGATPVPVGSLMEVGRHGGS